MSDEQSTANSNVSQDTSSDLLLDDKDVMCPVCKEVFVFPRTYECGHTVCELCMYEMDRRDRSGDTHIANVHHCPVCRHPTLRSWHNRPLSVLLEKIASMHPKYLERRLEVLEERSQREGNIMYIPKDIDLANASHTARIKLTLTLYDILVERLYKASLRGLSHLIIKDKAIVSEIEKVIDLLSVQLFARHNIYKMIVTRGECTIYIDKDAFEWRRSYENSSWDNPRGTDADSDTTSGPSRSARFSRVLGALLEDATSSSTIPPPPRSLLPPPGTFSPPPSRPLPPPGTFSRRRR